MSVRLYKLFFHSTPDPWTLTDPIPPVDSWPFRRGERVEAGRELRFPVSAAGSALDITIGGAWTGPIVVVSERIGGLVESLAPEDVQRIPARVDGTQERYELLHVLARIDCIDWENTPAYARRPGQARGENGTLASLGELINRDRLSRHVISSTMRLRPEGIDGARIFRVVNWHLFPVVTAEIKAALEDAGATGVTFQPVHTTP